MSIRTKRLKNSLNFVHYATIYLFTGYNSVCFLALENNYSKSFSMISAFTAIIFLYNSVVRNYAEQGSNLQLAKLRS